MRPQGLYQRNTACFEAEDNSRTRIPGVALIAGELPRRPQDQASRLAHQFLDQNRGLLLDFGTEGVVEFDGTRVDIELRTSGQVGALPLLSPTSGRPDYGLIIKPRFGWQGIGPMLGETGWKIIPEPLPLPYLPSSDRKIPPWVLSTTILMRLEKLLNQLERRFELTGADLRAPRGRIDWERYASVKMTRGAVASVPCHFPDLRDDQELKAAVHYALRRQLSGLLSQRTAGVVVLQLLRLCKELLDRVRDVPALRPSRNRLNSWLHSHVRTAAFSNGIEAVEWTVEDRGLAGLSELQGLPWRLPMEEFFEAWVETVIGQIARKTGGRMRSGRRRETITPLSWAPPYSGSQRYLLPDLILEREGETIIIDAKYRRHLEELEREGWHRLAREVRDQHRADLLQVLAYSTIPDSNRVTCCLAYPCREETWHSLLERTRPFHMASVRAGRREVKLVLAAVPMGVSSERVESVLAQALA